MLRVSHAAGEMECSVSFDSEDVLGDAPSLAHVLAAHGVPESLIDGPTVAELERLIASNQPAEDVVVARGREPVHGRDGWLEVVTASPERPEVGRDVVDHKEVGVPPFVKSGAIVAKLYRERPGVPGLSTKGEEIPSEDGEPCAQTVGVGLEVRDSGDVAALQDGFFIRDSHGIEIAERLHIKGDVSYETGHLRLEEGDVEVEGSVMPGFHIETPGSIFIKGDVDGATLFAGVDIEVEGLVSEGGGCILRAVGNIKVNRVSSAKLVAGGNIDANTELYEANAEAGGMVSVTGRVVGGEVFAAQGVEIGVAGGPGFTATRIEVGRNAARVKEAKQRLELLYGAIERLERLLSRSPGRVTLHRRVVGMKREQAQLSVMSEAMDVPLGSAKVRFLKALYPGCTVCMDGLSVQTDTPQSACSVIPGPAGHPMVEAA